MYNAASMWLLYGVHGLPFCPRSSHSLHLWVQDVTSNVGQLSDEERAQLVAHLKSKWSSVNTAYQKMTFTLDTPTKKKRKETYEAQLAEIEKDIQTLQRGDVILVVDD